MSTDGTNAFPSTRECPQCGFTVQSNEKFCSQCGTAVRRSLGDNAGTVAEPAPVSGGGGHGFTPLPSTSTTVLRKRKRRRKPPWYKRPRYLVPLILLTILLTAGGVFAYRTQSAFKEVQSVSTPPPEVSGSALGLEDDVSIDTGPAQQAILQRQQRESQRGVSSTQTPQPTQTVPPTAEVTDSAGVASTGTGTAEPTSDNEPTSQATTAESTTRSSQLVVETATEVAATDGVDTTASSSTAGVTEEASETPVTSTSSATEEASEPLASSESTEPAGTEAVSTAPEGTRESNASEVPALLSTPDSTPEEGTPVLLDVPDDSTPDSVMGSDPPELQSTDGITVLLMGVDARDGESIDIGVRPDSLAVLHIDPSTGSCRILAVPRDSRAVLPGYGHSKINHALAVGGIPYEMLVVEEYLGIELDNYVLVDFAGVESVVDELGGITVENPEAFVMEGQTFEAGELQLDGERALLYSRFRGDSEGDFGRISRQQQVLRALMQEGADVNLVRLVPNMFSLLSDHFRTDYGVTDLVELANTYRTSCNADSIETATIEGDVSMEHDELMQMDLSFVVSDPDDVADAVSWLLMRDEPASVPDDKGTPATDSRRDDDIQSTTVAHSVLLTGGEGPT